MANTEAGPSTTQFDFGYSFTGPVGFGFEKAQIVLRSAPTHRHFDPTCVTVPVYETGYDRLISLTITPEQNLSGRGNLRIPPGMISFRDRVPKQLDMYTYGGRLSVVKLGKDGACVSIVSSAPIIDLTYRDHNPGEVLAAFSQSLAARGLAQYYPCRQAEFYRLLYQSDPGDLYQTHLQALRNHYKAMKSGNLSNIDRTTLKAAEKELARLSTNRS